MPEKKIDVDTKTFVRFWLVIAAIALIAMFIYQARIGLLLVGISIFLAVAISPLTKRVKRLFGRKKDHQGIAAGVSVGLVVLVIGVFLAIIGPMVIFETAKFASQIPERIQEFGGWQGIDAVGERFGIEDAHMQLIAMLDSASKQITNEFSSAVVSSASALIGIIANMIIVIVLTILFLAQGPDILRWFWKTLDTRNNHASAVLKHVMERIAGVISKYIGGQMLVALIDGIVTGVIVFVLSLIFGFSSDSVFPMMLIAAIFYLIPMFGPMITAILVSLLLFFSAPAAGLAFLIIYIIYEQIANNVISPKVQGNYLNLPSLVILVAVTIGMYMFGLVGAIVSIPIAGCIRVVVEELPNIKSIHKKVEKK